MKNVVISILISILLMAVVGIWPLIYNYYFFSLAQLKNGIEYGDSYREVKQKFISYREEHQRSAGLQVIFKDNELFIYHVNSFDDCQLTVLFNEDGVVQEVAYIGD